MLAELQESNNVAWVNISEELTNLQVRTCSTKFCSACQRAPADTQCASLTSAELQCLTHLQKDYAYMQELAKIAVPLNSVDKICEVTAAFVGDMEVVLQQTKRKVIEATKEMMSVVMLFGPATEKADGEKAFEAELSKKVDSCASAAGALVRQREELMKMIKKHLSSMMNTQTDVGRTPDEVEDLFDKLIKFGEVLRSKHSQMGDWSKKSEQETRNADRKAQKQRDKQALKEEKGTKQKQKKHSHKHEHKDSRSQAVRIALSRIDMSWHNLLSYHEKLWDLWSCGPYCAQLRGMRKLLVTTASCSKQRRVSPHAVRTVGTR